MSSSTSPPSASRKPTSQTQSKDERLERSWRRGLTPPPRISVPEWADRFRKLAPEAGSTSGDWSTRTVEIARGPMLAVTELGVETITGMVCTQLMKTALIENAVGFFVHLDPAPKHHPDLDQSDISDLIDKMGHGPFGEIVGRAIFASRDTGAGNVAAPKKPSTRAPASTGSRGRKNGRKPA